MGTRPPQRSSYFVRLELGLAAFAPALGLLALRTRHHAMAYVFLAFAAVGVLVMIAAAIIVRRGNAEPFSFTSIEDLSDDVLGHVGALLLPVLVGPDSGTEEIVIAAIVIGVIIQIHVATGRVYVNPLLYLIGLRTYQGTTSDASFYLVARSDVSQWTTPRRCVQIGKSMLVERHR